MSALNGGLHLKDYEGPEGQRVLRGLCDEIFQHLLKNRVCWCQTVGSGRVWRRGWNFDIPGIGFICFSWEEVEDHGKAWLKDKDEQFDRALKRLDFDPKQNMCLIEDIVSESDFGEEYKKELDYVNGFIW